MSNKDKLMAYLEERFKATGIDANGKIVVLDESAIEGLNESLNELLVSKIQESWQRLREASDSIDDAADEIDQEEILGDDSSTGGVKETIESILGGALDVDLGNIVSEEDDEEMPDGDEELENLKLDDDNIEDNGEVSDEIVSDNGDDVSMDMDIDGDDVDGISLDGDDDSGVTFDFDFSEVLSGSDEDDELSMDVDLNGDDDLNGDGMMAGDGDMDGDDLNGGDGMMTGDGDDDDDDELTLGDL